MPQKHKIAIATDLEVLKDIGPTLGRPYADQIKGSKYNNLKELRTKEQWGYPSQKKPERFAPAFFAYNLF